MATNKIALIGGSRFFSLENMQVTHSASVKTPYGAPSAPLSFGRLGEQEVVYLPRRDPKEQIPPHKINYRANVWALRDAGVDKVIAVSAIMSLVEAFQIGDLILPDQLIDYTHDRESTFFGEEFNVHLDFSLPYSISLRKHLLSIAREEKLPIHPKATYGIIQGPRLETRAEGLKMVQDGCHLVGMTGMPEAVLMRELGLDYVCVAQVIGNKETVTEQDEARISNNEQGLQKWLYNAITSLPA